MNLLAENESPVIAICAYPWVVGKKDANGDVADYEQNPYYPTRQYISASYCKYVEMCGARVVPVNYWASRDEMFSLLSQCNGLLLPGGDGRLNEYTTQILDIAIEINQTRPFPVLGICLGFQYIGMYFARQNGWLPDEKQGQNNFHFLENFPVLSESTPIRYTEEAKHSPFYQELSPKMIESTQQNPCVAQFHNFGIATDRFNKYLENDFHLIATDHAVVKFEGDVPSTRVQPTDIVKDNLHYKDHVTIMEHKKYPILAVQFHPEKPIFEWGYDSAGEHSKISRSKHTILFSQFIANYFVFQTKENFAKFKNPFELYSKWIYNYTPIRHGKGVLNMYFIDHWYPPTCVPQSSIDAKQEKDINITTKQIENTANTPATTNQTFDFNTKTVIPHSDKQSAASMIA